MKSDWIRYLEETGHISDYDLHCDCSSCQSVRREYPRWLLSAHPHVELRIAVGTIAVLCALALTGCATTPQYGDGKIFGAPIDPAIDALASAIDAKAPGAGEHLRKWYSTAGMDRVPPGYIVKWTAYYQGQIIDPEAIVRVPTLAPKAAGPVMPVEVAAPDAPVDLGAILEDIGNATK